MPVLKDRAFSDRSRNICLKHEMPLWAIGVANADKESVKKYFICFNNSFVSLVNIRHEESQSPP